MKKNPSRYREAGIEGEWQPRSGKRVLRNLKEIARWLADLMLFQAGYPLPLYNFSGRGSVKRKADYLDAVIQGYGQNYAPLAAFFRACVEARLRELEE